MFERTKRGQVNPHKTFKLTEVWNARISNDTFSKRKSLQLDLNNHWQRCLKEACSFKNIKIMRKLYISPPLFQPFQPSFFPRFHLLMLPAWIAEQVDHKGNHQESSIFNGLTSQASALLLRHVLRHLRLLTVSLLRVDTKQRRRVVSSDAETRSAAPSCFSCDPIRGRLPVRTLNMALMILYQRRGLELLTVSEGPWTVQICSWERALTFEFKRKKKKKSKWLRVPHC